MEAVLVAVSVRGAIGRQNRRQLTGGDPADFGGAPIVEHVARDTALKQGHVVGFLSQRAASVEDRHARAAQGDYLKRHEVYKALLNLVCLQSPE